MINVKYLHKWKRDGNQIAIFGAGKNGYTYYQILKLLGIELDCFVDNDSCKWNTEVYDSVKCYPPDYLSGKDGYLTFVCIGPPLLETLREQASSLNIVHVEDMNEIIDDIIRNYRESYLQILRQLPFGAASDCFYENNPNSNLLETENVNAVKVTGERIAVYTCIFGAYDEVIEPSFVADNIDYYFVSDTKPPKLETYKWLDAGAILPEGLDSPIKKNRFVKMHPHLLFPEYKYSIYIDGNVQVLGNVEDFLYENSTGISVFMHPLRRCLYYEALTVVNCRRVTAEDVYKQMSQYLSEGMPMKYGLAEMSVIVREHHKDICIKIMEEWWEEFSHQSQRDQLSFMYVMWKNGMKLSDLTSLGDDMCQCDKISRILHKKPSRDVVNEKTSID